MRNFPQLWFRFLHLIEHSFTVNTRAGRIVSRTGIDERTQADSPLLSRDSLASMLPNSLLPTLLPKPQFRAVILCGFGVDLFPLVEPPTPSLSTSSQNDHSQVQGPGQGQTKALLPVAGKKMIDWVLERVEQAGVFGTYLDPFLLPRPMFSTLTSSVLHRHRRLDSRLDLETYGTPPPCSTIHPFVLFSLASDRQDRTRRDSRRNRFERDCSSTHVGSREEPYHREYLDTIRTRMGAEAFLLPT